jgi:DNA-binding MarR family transcriptional regulator
VDVIDAVLADPDRPVAAEEAVLAGQLGFLIGRLAHGMRRPALAAGITPTRLASLCVLAEGPCRQADLAAQVGVSQASMSRLTAILEEQKWVTREVDPTDHRAWLLTLTPFGADTLSDVRRTGTAELVAAVAALSRAQRATLIKALPILEALVNLGDRSGDDGLSRRR